MMSSHSGETFIDPVFRRRMPSYNENMSPAGLSKPPNVSSFLGKQALQYFSYEPREKDGAAFPVPWSSSKSSVVDGRSPVSNLSGMDRLHNIIYRQDSSPEQSHSAQRHTPAKQGFTLYTKSPGLSSPQSTASVIVRKSQTGDESVSPNKPVYLAVPQPVYGHSPCCSDLCCVMCQRYSVEQASPPLPNRVYKHTWRKGEPLYSDSLSSQHKAPDLLLHQKAADALLQQRRLYMEAQAETQKSMFSPERTRTLPTVLDQTYSPTKLRQVFGPASEQNQCLQASPRAYPGLYPSHTTYEPVIYHNHSPISKYGQAAQHPVFYYPPANVEVEKRTESKDSGPKHTEEVPVVLKHAIQSSRNHYMIAPSLHRDMSLPLSRIEALPKSSFSQGFDYPGYMVPRLNINTSQIHSPLKHPHTLHPKYINTSPPQHMHLPGTSVATVHKDKFTQHTEHSSPFVRVEQTNPTTCTTKSSVAPSSTQSHNRYCPPRSGVHMGPQEERVHLGAPRGSAHAGSPLVASAHLGFDLHRSRLHSCQVRSYLKHPHTPPPHTALSNRSNMQKILYCPPLATDTQNSPNPQLNFPKGPRKRSISVSSPIKIQDDDDDVCVVETDHKRRKIKKGNAEMEDSESSPPMPVINNVFSLAPYQTYLQMSRLCLGRFSHRPVHSEVNAGRAQQFNESLKQSVVSRDLQSESPVDEMALRHTHLLQCEGSIAGRLCSPPMKVTCKQVHPEDRQQQFCLETPPEEVRVKQESLGEPPDTCAVVSKELDLPKVKPAEEKREPPIIKKEIVLTDEDSSSEMSVCPEQLKIIKREPEETDMSDCVAMLEIKKCELDDDAYDKHSCGGECALRNSSPRSETSTPVRTPPAALSAPPRPESKLNFLNIPPQCLKLSTYNIILPEANLPRTVQLTAKPPVLPPPVSQAPVPKIELQMPVRKHFFELHQSLIKLISKSVAATSEDTLRSWLSKMELSNVASSKSQKVSCLFGVKGRDACLNEEMKSSLRLVLQRLTEYTSQERCPFPFVVRTGAIFLPMLVVKEVLFSTVQGALIDQVLQKHKVELRPTTLSEEKTLIQLHKRACSSRLRRLMSLKHLPDVYSDVVNLLYYTCVCKQLGLEMSVSLHAEHEESCEGPSRSPAISPPSSPHKELQTKSLLKRRSRIKSSSRRFFLDCSSDEEPENSFEMEPVLNSNQEESSEPQSFVATENSWMCPLASSEFSTVDVDTGNSSSMHHSFEPSLARQSQEKSKSCSGVILKLRRTFSRKRMSYQAVLDSDNSHLKTGKLEAELNPERSSELVRRWKRTPGPVSHSLRPLNSKRKRSSLLKIKYCPYLSACHSAEHRRRWVLRSAVQRARGAMKIYYPDLVGKRIHHLYEEDDKSEVWYRGEVLRVHKAHPNPLKTVFEVRYDGEPEWRYYLELLIDYKKGWLKIEE